MASDDHEQWERWRKQGGYDWLRTNQHEGARETLADYRLAFERIGRAILRQRGRCEQCGEALVWATCPACDAAGASQTSGELCPNCAGNGGYWTHAGEAGR